MTTTVYAYSSYVMDGCELQIIHRNVVTGEETLLMPDVTGFVVHTHHVYDHMELVFRETKKAATAPVKV